MVKADTVERPVEVVICWAGVMMIFFFMFSMMSSIGMRPISLGYRPCV